MYRYRWVLFWVIVTIGSFITFSSCKNSGNISDFIKFNTIPDFTESNTGPYVLNIHHLEFIKEHLDSLPVASREYQRLIDGADKLLLQKFSFITEKESPPSSGDKHDYMSLHRYSYYNPVTGKYDIIKDSQTNPEIYDYDRPKLAQFSNAVYALSLAYYFSGKEEYAKKASELLHGWFLDPATSMNPNMKYAQVAKGLNDGRGMLQGIIDANDFIRVVEGVSLLYDSKHWTNEDHIDLKKWFYRFSNWIDQNYDVDTFEATNVSTWLDVQRASYFLFTEQTEYLNSSSHIMPVKQKISIQITPEGVQKNEKMRRDSQGYFSYNLEAYMNLALIRKNRSGRDRDWPDLATNDHAGLKPAIESIISYLNGYNVSLYFRESDDFDRCRYLEVFLPASIAFESKEYEMIAKQLLNSGCSNPNLTLVFPPLSDIQR